MDIVARQPTTLSNDLNIITAEINAYQRVAGEAIFEIGRRLKHVKENDLAHGEFMEWYTDLGMTKDFVSKSIKIAVNLSGTYFQSNEKLGIEMLNQIATMEPEEREKEYITSKGEVKKVEDMTVKELREVKKQLKAEKECIELDKNKNQISKLKKEIKSIKKENLILKSCDLIGRVKGVKAKEFVAELVGILTKLNYELPEVEYHVKNFYIDMYFPELKLGFEFDEPHHKYQNTEDIMRQKEIEKELSCKIIRLDQSDGYTFNIAKVMSYLPNQEA